MLAKLRDDLDLAPSPVPGSPGLLMRDPFRYSEAAIVLPPALVRCLACFDGAHTADDLRSTIVALTGRNDLDQAADGLINGLSEAGFLEDDVFRTLRRESHDAFERSPVRRAAFAGGGYPGDSATLARTIDGWLADGGLGDRAPALAQAAPLVAIAAPHVTPSGGASSYGAAYRALRSALPRSGAAGAPASPDDRTFVVLGTSHYGPPDRFGLTRKSFSTPFGEAQTDTALVDELVRAAPAAIDLEDYCHAVEHSIEFQILFLQDLYGPSVRILPILCNAFSQGASSTSSARPSAAGTRAGRPEDDGDVARMLGALGDMQAKHGDRLVWVLGVDMAHVGRRYGDAWDARAHQGAMNDVASRDEARLATITAGNADHFWALLHERGHDDLKWCGSAPLYAFLRANPRLRGQVLDYEQWNIDERSVVSFAAIAFR